jgi:hypothetical protein
MYAMYDFASKIQNAFNREDTAVQRRGRSLYIHFHKAHAGEAKYIKKAQSLNQAFHTTPTKSYLISNCAAICDLSLSFLNAVVLSS